MPEFTNHQSWKWLTKLVSSPEACPGTASTALPKSFKWQVDLQEEKISPLTQCFLILILKFLLNSIALNVHGGSQKLNSPFLSDKLCTKKLENTSPTVHKHTSTTSQNCTNSPYTPVCCGVRVEWLLTLINEKYLPQHFNMQISPFIKYSCQQKQMSHLFVQSW